MRAGGPRSNLESRRHFEEHPRIGKKGWHSRGYLPHFDGYDLTQHIVFRLHDAVPPGQQEGDDVLDRGHGSSLLRDPRCARIVTDALMHHDEERYLLKA